MLKTLNTEVSSIPVIKKTYVYDIETLRGYFSAAFIDVDSDERHLFEVYITKDGKVRQIGKLVEFLLTKCKGLIGYNNLSFDWPVLDFVIKNKDFLMGMKKTQHVVLAIYDVAQSLIKSKGNYRGATPSISQLDLLAMNNFNSKAMFVSLKQLEFVMRYENVQDMPFKHTYRIKTKAEAKLIADYNFNDVLATKMFYKKCADAIKLRKDLSVRYGTNLANHSNTGLGKESFAYELTRDMGLTRTQLNKLKTVRTNIDVGKEVILPMIEFKTKPFQDLLKFYKMQNLKVLKGFFKDIPTTIPGYDYIRLHAYPPHVGKNGTLEALSVMFKGHCYVYGNGGIHSYFEGKKVVACDKYCIWDVDV